MDVATSHAFRLVARLCRLLPILSGMYNRKPVEDLRHSFLALGSEVEETVERFCNVALGCKSANPSEIHECPGSLADQLLHYSARVLPAFLELTNKFLATPASTPLRGNVMASITSCSLIVSISNQTWPLSPTLNPRLISGLCVLNASLPGLCLASKTKQAENAIFAMAAIGIRLFNAQIVCPPNMLSEILTTASSVYGRLLQTRSTHLSKPVAFTIARLLTVRHQHIPPAPPLVNPHQAMCNASHSAAWELGTMNLLVLTRCQVTEPDFPPCGFLDLLIAMPVQPMHPQIALSRVVWSLHTYAKRFPWISPSCTRMVLNLLTAFQESLPAEGEAEDAAALRAFLTHYARGALADFHALRPQKPPRQGQQQQQQQRQEDEEFDQYMRRAILPELLEKFASQRVTPISEKLWERAQVLMCGMGYFTWGLELHCRETCRNLRRRLYSDKERRGLRDSLAVRLMGSICTAFTATQMILLSAPQHHHLLILNRTLFKILSITEMDEQSQGIISKLIHHSLSLIRPPSGRHAQHDQTRLSHLMHQSLRLLHCTKQAATSPEQEREQEAARNRGWLQQEQNFVTQFPSVGPLLTGCCSLRCNNLTEASEALLPTLLCSGCRRARYCSVRCQRQAWQDGHKRLCKAASGS